MQAMFVPLFGGLVGWAYNPANPPIGMISWPKLAALADRCKWVEVCHQLLIGETTHERK
jgi:hypothetical protein